MRIYTVCFFGHRIVSRPLEVETKLQEIIKELLHTKEYVEFLVGRDGDFDQIVASTVRRCKREYRSDNSSLIWVLPYCKAELQANEEAFRAYYDDIEICEQSAGKHYKGAFKARNQAMIDRSDLVVVCVERSSGGANTAKQYAEKQGKQVINVAQLGTHY